MKFENMLQDAACHWLCTLVMFIQLILYQEFVHQLLNLRSVDFVFLDVLKLAQNDKGLNIMYRQLLSLVARQIKAEVLEELVLDYFWVTVSMDYLCELL